MAYKHDTIQMILSYAKAHSVSSASKKFNMKPEIIKRWLRREEVAGSALARTSFKEIKNYIDAHPKDSYKKISEALGVHFTTVAFCCRKHGVHRDRPKSKIAEKVVEFCKKNPTWTKRAVAQHFNISQSYVSQIRKNNGLSQDRREALLPMDVLEDFLKKNRGATNVQIAERFGVSVYVVREKMRRLGLDKASREIKVRDDVILLANEKPWLSYSDISSTFGVSMAYVRRVLREAGLRGYRRYQIKGWREYEK